MIREIFEEPKIIRDTLSYVEETIKNYNFKISRIREYSLIYITGSGTSYHAGLAGSYSLSSIAGVATSLVQASEFQTWVPPSVKNFLLLAFSQSGESTDVIAAVKAAIRRKGDVLAVTNTKNSTLANLSKFQLITKAGKELAVTATKTYVAQLSAVYSFSVELGKLMKTLTFSQSVQLMEKLHSVPKLIENILQSQSEKIMEIAEKYKQNTFIFLLGSGPNYATSLEGALKLKESCNIYAEGHAAREFLHGPMQLVNEQTPIFFLIPTEETEIKEWIQLINRFRNFGVPTITISYENEAVIENATDSIIIPKGLPSFFTPILYVVPLQLFSYYISVARGYNPDSPEKLSKVVKE